MALTQADVLNKFKIVAQGNAKMFIKTGN